MATVTSLPERMSLLPPPSRSIAPREFISPYHRYLSSPIFDNIAIHGQTDPAHNRIHPSRGAPHVKYTLEHKKLQEMNDACKLGKLPLLQSLVTEWKLNQDPPPGPPGYEIYALESVFYTAIRESQSEIVEYFLNRGISMCKLALEEAMECGSTSDVFQIFLDRGWDINDDVPISPTAGGFAYSPLCMILQGGDNKELVKWFLDHGADPNSRARVSFRPNITNFAWAARHNSFSIIQLMYNAGARPISPILPYAMARPEDRLHIMTFLLDIGADINATESDDPVDIANFYYRGTAINFASSADGDEELEILLQRGCRTDIHDWRGMTCLEIARDCGMKRKVELLEAYIEKHNLDSAGANL